MIVNIQLYFLIHLYLLVWDLVMCFFNFNCKLRLDRRYLCLFAWFFTFLIHSIYSNKFILLSTSVLANIPEIWILDWLLGFLSTVESLIMQYLLHNWRKVCSILWSLDIYVLSHFPTLENYFYTIDPNNG